MGEQIELLSTDLLEEKRELVEEFKHLGETLDVGLGWHYLLDLTWAADLLEGVAGPVLDAGAGIGLMQWWLADRGVDVLSVDEVDRSQIDMRFRRWCRVSGFAATDLGPRVGLRDLLPSPRPSRWRHYPTKLQMALRPLDRSAKRRGTVTLHQADLAHLEGVPEGSFEAVVSISALEHNQPELMTRIVEELTRVLRPGGVLIATIAASADQDWFHEPSGGWALTEDTIREVFDLSDPRSNFHRYDEFMEALSRNAELRDGLAEFYFEAGDNGMPWGVWDPKYHPVGIRRFKRT